MLNHPTFEKLQTLRLTGMCKAWEDQAQLPDCDSLSFEERLGLLVDRELTERDDRRLKTRLRTAKLRQPATVEDLDYRHPRGLDKTLMTRLVTCQWIADHATVLITGPTGVGKTWLACALAHKACRAGYTAQYLRLPRLWRDLAMAKGDGRYPKLLASWAKLDLLLLDDFGLEALTEDQRRDLLEILEDRHGTRATLVTSQLPTDRWHDVIGEPTLADAILDRLIHHAYQLPLIRRLDAQETQSQVDGPYRNRVTRISPASLRSDSEPGAWVEVAGLRWIHWPASRGMGGRLGVDSVADIRGIRRR